MLKCVVLLVLVDVWINFNLRSSNLYTTQLASYVHICLIEILMGSVCSDCWWTLGDYQTARNRKRVWARQIGLGNQCRCYRYWCGRCVRVYVCTCAVCVRVLCVYVYVSLARMLLFLIYVFFKIMDSIVFVCSILSLPIGVRAVGDIIGKLGRIQGNLNKGKVSSLVACPSSWLFYASVFRNPHMYPSLPVVLSLLVSLRQYNTNTYQYLLSFSDSRTWF